MNRVLVTVALITFGSTLFSRQTDPIIPMIAEGFDVLPITAALLTTAYALPYALLQPVLGAMADVFGKARLMMVCLAIGALATIVSGLAISFPMLMASRVFAGAVSGGVFPIAVAVIGDRSPIAQRQVAIGRVLAAGMLGNLVGASFSGVIGDLWGWRSAFIVIGVIAAAMLIPAQLFLRQAVAEKPVRFSVTDALANYRTIFTNPLAKVCFGAVFLDAVVIFGLFPYLATMLQTQGENRASIAGVILAGFSVGAVIYSVAVKRLLAIFGDRWLMIGGGLIMAATLIVVALRPSWPVETVNFLIMGIAFFMLHGSIQVYVTELSATARASAMALHSSSFFFGQALGPVLYGVGFTELGTAWTFGIAAAVITAVGVWCGTALRHTPMARPQSPPAID